LILIVAAGFAAVAGFGYWTRVDKRFLLPVAKSGDDQVNRPG
jgi:hypothetical protein